MQDEDEDSHAPVPWEALHPLLDWMLNNNVDRLRLVALRRPPQASDDPLRDETQNLLYCDEAPDSPGLLNVYTVTDEEGRGGLNGPSRVPQHVLRPVLRALDEAAVSELVIAAEDVDSGTALTQTVTATLEDEFEEHTLPLSQGCSPVLIAVRVV